MPFTYEKIPTNESEGDKQRREEKEDQVRADYIAIIDNALNDIPISTEDDCKLLYNQLLGINSFFLLDSSQQNSYGYKLPDTLKNVYATLFLSDRFLDTSLLSEADKKAAVSEYQKLIQSRIIKKFEQLDKNPKSAIADHNHNREEEKSVAPISLEEAEKIKMPPKEITYNQQLAHLVAKKLVAHDETSSLLASRFHSSLFSICPVEKLLTLGRTNVDELVVLQKNAQQNFSPLNNGKITQKTIDTLMDFVAGGCLTLTEAYKLNSEEINFLTDPKIARFIQNEFQENGNYNSKVIPTLLELSRNNGKKDFLQFYNSDKADLTVALEKYAETENAYKSNSANATWRSNTVNEIINEEVKNFGELLKAKGYDPEQNDPAKKLFDEYKERVSTPKKRKELLNIFSYSATEKEAKQRIADDVNVVLYQSSMENDNLRRSSFDKSKPWASIQDDVNGLDIHHKIRAPLENAINEKIGAYKKELGFDFKNDKEAQHILNYFESEINSVAAKKIKKLLTETGEINFDKIATDIVEAAKKDPLLGSNPSDIPFYIASEKFAELSVTNAKAEIQKRVDEAVKQVWGIGKYNDSFKSFNPRFSHIVGDCSSIAMLHGEFIREVRAELSKLVGAKNEPLDQAIIEKTAATVFIKYEKKAADFQKQDKEDLVVMEENRKVKPAVKEQSQTPAIKDFYSEAKAPSVNTSAFLPEKTPTKSDTTVPEMHKLQSPTKSEAAASSALTTYKGNSDNQIKAATWFATIASGFSTIASGLTWLGFEKAATHVSMFSNFLSTCSKLMFDSQEPVRMSSIVASHPSGKNKQPDAKPDNLETHRP